MTTVEMDEYLFRKGFIKLLEIKDSDIRILTLKQCRDAVDKGIHIGGAFSAVIPLVSLFYGGIIQLDIADPTRPGRIVWHDAASERFVQQLDHRRTFVNKGTDEAARLCQSQRVTQQLRSLLLFAMLMERDRL